tara:strand:- start:1020 stop:1388 length:369 start_codon:yes stop_codon:yes gene_type:complete
MTIYVDIDGTICTSTNGNYKEAEPLFNNIKKINKLYDRGNTIIYWTARGSITGIDWTELTTIQLKEWGAKYHKISLNKPHFDLYICDKSINSNTFFNDQQKLILNMGLNKNFSSLKKELENV